MTKSILSKDPDGAGYHYGFLDGDPRQLNVLVRGNGFYSAYVGDDYVGTYPTKDDAEEAAIAWARNEESQP